MSLRRKRSPKRSRNNKIFTGAVYVLNTTALFSTLNNERQKKNEEADEKSGAGDGVFRTVQT